MRKPGLILTALLFGAAGALACGLGDRSVQAGGSVPAMSPEVPSTPSQGTIRIGDAVKNLKLPIIFEVTGSAKADITYMFGFKPSVRIKGASTPWTWTTQNSEPVIAATLKARTTSANKNATVTCRIKMGDDIILTEDSARGPHALADCSGPPAR